MSSLRQWLRQGLRDLLLILVFLVGVPLSALAQLGGKPEKTNFMLSYTQASGAFTPLWVAQDAGLFRKHDLDATLRIESSKM